MNQDSNRQKSSGIFRFISHNCALIIALVIFIIVLKVAWSSQINHRGDAFWDGVLYVFFVGSGVIFTILMTVHFAIIKAPLRFILVLLSLFLSAIFFYFCIQLTNFSGYNYNNYSIQHKINKIAQNIEQIVTLKDTPLTNQELFLSNGLIIKAEKEPRIQYYYLNDNLKELIEMKSLENKDISSWGSVFSPSKKKIAIDVDDQIQIFSQDPNYSSTISIDPVYKNFRFGDFFFEQDEKLIFTLYDSSIYDSSDSFLLTGIIDSVNKTITFDKTNLGEEYSWLSNKQDQNNSCENITEIDIHSYSTRSYQSLSNNSCLYVTASYDEKGRREVYVLKLYDALAKSTKILLEGDYTNIDLINIIYISI